MSVALDPIDPAALLADFTRGAGGAGAIVSFTGVVRAEDGSVGTLWLDHHPILTDRVIAEIAEDARLRFDIAAVTIAHRAGSVAAGDPIVFVAAAARHRRAAFDAVDYVMDRLKTDAPFWKRESGPGGARWIEARAGDHADRARWEQSA